MNSLGTRLRHPVVLVLIGIASVQVGAAFAKSIFDDASPTVVVWLRLLTSAVILVAVTRPSLRGRSGHDLLVVLGFGTSLAVMNLAIYESFARIPIGLAVTIEFVGPLTVALLGSRRRVDLVWVALAAVGVLLLGAERANLDVVGVLWALLAGAMWGCYILLSAETGRRWTGLDGLAVASVVGVLLIAPLLVLTDARGLGEPHILLIGVAVGLLSSVIPYSCELWALRTLPAATFGILMSLEPAAAALAALAVLGEELSLVQWLAVACVVAASIGVTRNASRIGQT